MIKDNVDGMIIFFLLMVIIYGFVRVIYNECIIKRIFE